VQGALQYNSTPEKNLIKDGFLAKGRADEKWNGPQARVYVTRAFKDVTAAVLDGLDKIKGDRERFEKIEARQKELVATCEKGRPGIRCSVAKFFEGAQFFQIEQLELRDIRLVYAPAAGIGNYGGEIDNWRWPRHTGDFSFYRAYVAPDGQPADHAAENVPYKPVHHLKLASKPLAEGDLVFVAGYPGRTYRHKTQSEVAEAVDWYYPRRLRFCQEYATLLEGMAAKDKELAIKATPLIRGLNNAMTNTRGQLEGLVKGGLAGQKAKLEADLRAFIDADPARKAKYAGVLEKMASLHDANAKLRERDASLGELLRLPKLPGAAVTLVRMAEERPKADAERKPDYQERNWKRHEQAQQALDKSYTRSMDRALLTLALERIDKLPAADRDVLLTAVLGRKPGKAPLKAGEIEKAVNALYEKTTLEDEKVRLKLLSSATTAELRKSKDPLIALALRLRPLEKEQEERDEAYTGAMSLERPRYIAALRELAGGVLAPDANSTLRLTYGTVRGYKPSPDKPAFRPFTTLTEVVSKATGQEPFNAPPALLAAAKARKFGPYIDAKVGDVPVDFLADLHITGGNSGSATLNARGELVGLVFDGNYEAMASDWVFIPPITRSIHVDLRYILWVMDAVDGADGLLKEMGVKPAIE
jgi:hypothetical protein